MAGTELTVQVVQDGTGGRTITWGSDFQVQTAIDTAANKWTIWNFIWVGSKWRQVSASSTF